MHKFLVMVVAAGLSLNVVAADFQSEVSVKSTSTAHDTVSQAEAVRQVNLMEARASISVQAGGGVSTMNGSKVSSSSAKTAVVSHFASKSKNSYASSSHGHSNGASRALNVPHATKTRCVKKVSGDVTEEVCQVAVISMEEATYLIETEAQMNRSLSQARVN